MSNLYAGTIRALYEFRENTLDDAPSAACPIWANDEQEAIASLLEAARKRWPSTWGYHSHAAQAVRIPDDWILAVAAERQVQQEIH